MPDYPLQNTGILPETRPDDFLQGIIPYKVILESGDWRPFLPEGEPQYSQVADSFSCVSFANNNQAEIQLKQQGLDYNFSDRALSKLSQTVTALNTPDKTKWGNSLMKVADTSYRVGRILESDWPLPSNFSLTTFFADIPQSVMDKVIFFDEDSAFISGVPDSLSYHLKQCPIQITIPYPYANHDVVLVYIEGTTAWYFDSYPGSTNYLKTMPVGDIQAAMKLTIKPRTMTKYYIIKDGSKLGILISEGYSASVVYAADLPDFQKLKDAVNAPDDMKTIELPQ